MADASVSFPSTAPNSSEAPPFEIAEDEYTPCPCATPDSQLPLAQCLWCFGSGYRLTRRLMRPRSTFDEQAALAVIRTREATIRKAVATLEHAAQLFLKLGHPKEASQTTAAAKALAGQMDE